MYGYSPACPNFNKKKKKKTLPIGFYFRILKVLSIQASSFGTLWQHSLTQENYICDFAKLDYLSQWCCWIHLLLIMIVFSRNFSPHFNIEFQTSQACDADPQAQLCERKSCPPTFYWVLNTPFELSLDSQIIYIYIKVIMQKKDLNKKEVPNSKAKYERWNRWLSVNKKLKRKRKIPIFSFFFLPQLIF